MWPRKTAICAVFWTLYFFTVFPHGARSTGVFQLQIRSFNNDLGLTQNGSCCNGYRQNGICSESCRTYFFACLTHFQADIAKIASPEKCTFSNRTTPVLGGNTMEFSELSRLPVQNARQNTFYFPIREFQWPGDFSLIIEARHEPSLDSLNEDKGVLISRLATIRSARSGEEWTEFETTFNYGARLRYAFRFQCDTNYYGPNCATMCRPRDDEFGHYSCNATDGSKTCLNGWRGEYCDVAICLPNCDPNNAYCDNPNECICKYGWQGKHCTECIRYLGCHHGTCSKPWECNCEEGWGGQLCNQDLNFCTHHTPCKNGGLCTNSGQGSYSCTCPPGYEGENCERDVGDCQILPCVNGGTCRDVGSGRHECHCPHGFYGTQCQKQAVSCMARPCNNGGTCVEQGDSYYCICAAGYTDYNCATEVDECKSQPCQNGGQCVDQLAGYRCVCQSGYSGSECQDDEDDCAGNPCGEHGYCVDLRNDYCCQCHAGFVGSGCLENVDECEMRPCANGGRCTDLINDFQCDCARGWEGKDCSLQIDECRDSPCLHGGICSDQLADYTCSCPEGFWGKNCEKYEGMPVEVDGTTGSGRTNLTARTPIWHTTVANTDTGGQMDSSTGEHGEGEGGLSMTELLVIVCLGVGIPLILIIIAVAILLCRKRSYLQQRQHTQQNLENMAREKERHYINNMNNKSSTTVSSNLSSPTSDANIFTTLPQSASNSSSIKISNEEQQDINKLKAKHLMLAGDCGLTTSYNSDMESPTGSSSASNAGAGGGGGSTLKHLPSGSSPHPRSHNTACPSSYLRDVVAITHKELRLQTPSPPSSSSSVLPSSSACPPTKGARRDSDCDLDNEKTYRRLDVDSLQVDTNRPLSEYQRHHSQHKKSAKVVNPPQVPLDYSASESVSTINTVSSRDTAYTTSPTTVYLGGYNSSLPSLTPQQQQLLQEQLKRHSRYDEDFLATEV